MRTWCPSTSSYATRPRRGIILLLVLVVVTMLALGSIGFAELMLNEHRAAQTASRQSQARAFAHSGAELARQFLDRTAADQQAAGGVYDNAARFASQIVASDPSPRDQGRFTIIAPKIEDRTITSLRYGLQDESARINLAAILNFDKASQGSKSSGSSGTSVSSGSLSSSSGSSSTSKTILMGLPGMTDEIADSILDWMDDDDTQREQGAETEYYSGLSPGYAPRNRPPVTIDELLLVKGVTPELLFGLDAARMGLSSGDASAASTFDNSDGSMDHGWAQYLTLWSAESNLKADGTPKININDKDLKTLHDSLKTALDEESADFIVAYRMGGGTLDGGHLDTSKLDTAKARNTIGSMLDLIGAPVRALDPSGGTGSVVGAKATPLKNPFSSDSSSMSTYLPKLFDNCTTSAKSVAGRININQAPRPVLMCIPGMTTDLADQIIANRTPDSASPNGQNDRTCPAWPLIEGYVPLPEMKAMLPYITVGGSVYRAQIIGSFDKGNPVARIEVVIDASKVPARILFWKDVSHVTGGFPAEAAAAAESH